MDKLNFVQSVKVSPLSRQLPGKEMLILTFRLVNKENNMVATTTTSSLRHRMLEWVKTGKWLHE